MKYVIKRLDQGGGYVAPVGSARSYTQDATKARTFDSKEAAQRDACDNETPVSVASLIERLF